MKVEINAEYSKEEVEAMIMATHVAAFGIPPDGDQWEVEERYNRWCVRNREIPAEPTEDELKAETPDETEVF